MSWTAFLFLLSARAFGPAFGLAARACRRPALCLVAASLAGVLGACGAARVGVGVPVGPFTLGMGAGPGGPSLGMGAGIGPLGVGVNAGGQVTGNVGLGASVPLAGGPARAGVGVGTGAVLHDPRRAPAPTFAPAPAPERPGVVVPGGAPRPAP